MRTVCKGLFADSACRKLVCRLFKQSGDYIFHQFLVIFITRNMIRKNNNYIIKVFKESVGYVLEKEKE